MKLLISNDKQWIVLERGLIAGLVIFVLYFLTAFKFGTLLTDDGRQADFQMWYLLPPSIAASDYPSVITGNWNIPFPYLPSAIAMLLPLNLMPRTAAFVVWMALQCASFAAILWASLHLAGIAQSRVRLPVAAAAVFIASAAIEWDLRAHNNNLIYLALIMLGLMTKWTWLSATLFAVTANLKFYSGVLLFGFLWRREYRLAAHLAAAGLLIAIVIPLLIFGPAQFTKLSGSWINEFLYLTSAAGQTAAPLSMRKTAAALLGLDAGASAVRLMAISAQGLWVVAVLAYFAVAARPGAPAGETGTARLCDVIVMLMLPLPLSAWFVPYHAVVMLPAFVLIVAALIDDRQRHSVRIMAAIACAGCIVLRFGFRPWELRAGVYFASFVLILLALGAIRMSLGRAIPAQHSP
jgi:Glycosyltransferase family 87